MRKLAFVSSLLVAGCPIEVTDVFNLDCTDVDGILIGESGTVGMTYMTGADAPITWIVDPAGTATVSPIMGQLQDTGQVRTFVARTTVFPIVAGTATISVFRDREPQPIASCTVRFDEEVGEDQELTVVVNGQGTIQSDPPGINCVADDVTSICQEQFERNTQTELIATPAPGYRFDSVDGEACDRFGNSVFVVMDRSRQCTFNFIESDPEVQIGAGSFLRGCPDNVVVCPGNATPDTVELTQGLFIDQHEVTTRAYRSCVEAGSCTPTREAGAGERPCNFHEIDREDHPINCVDWFQATSYCGFMGKRLPTEAEWERAAGGPDQFIFPWGDGLPNCDRANIILSEPMFLVCEGETFPVGSLADGDSPDGLHDMAGNVEEWVSDWYDGSYYTDPTSLTDPQGPVSSPSNQRAVRGGGFQTISDFARTFDRSRPRIPESTEPTLGFRCARSTL